MVISVHTHRRHPEKNYLYNLNTGFEPDGPLGSNLLLYFCTSAWFSFPGHKDICIRKKEINFKSVI
ncbi:hypothetical protein A2Z33_00635 [Candidatus Gottesmanbacteria bacterium RBG_16_52_11]|uniref:Uncharacterized protein n=1 Tax=Candidatus Gottesmanbacteria bacterium RBG_16_52_11 TaxID=1798374 RepID=A0A1F5YNJ2_9BACT|nr:MAG: hypothetical protein A2Z33_00635 [Candidatus Gottesmanbacteria bacterium RBG_16_52_11]